MLQVAQNDLSEAREGLKSAECELLTVREELITSWGELRDLQVELRAVNGDLNDWKHNSKWPVAKLPSARCC